MSWVPLGEDELDEGRGSATLEANLDTHDRQATPLRLLRFDQQPRRCDRIPSPGFDYCLCQ